MIILPSKKLSIWTSKKSYPTPLKLRETDPTLLELRKIGPNTLKLRRTRKIKSLKVSY
jgi:hypothetical protein